MKAPRSLAARVAFRLTAVAAVATLLTGVLAVAVAGAAVKNAIGRGYRDRAEDAAIRVDRTMAETLAQLRVWSGQKVMQGVQTGDKDGQIAFFLYAAGEQYPQFDSISVTDAQGKVVASSRLDLSGINVAARPWFPAVAAARDEVVDVAPDPDTTEMVVTLVVPIRDEADGSRALGAVIAGYKAKEFSRLVQTDALADAGQAAGDAGSAGGEKKPGARAARTARRGGAEVLIVRQDGMLIAAPAARAKELFQRNFAGEGWNALEDAGAGRSGYRIDRAANGWWVAGYAPAKGWGDYHGLGWRVLVVEGAGSAFAPIFWMALLLMGVVLGSAAVAVWLARLLARELVEPLAAMTTAATAVAAGDFTGRLDERAGDSIETTLLAERFNSMGVSLAALLSRFRDSVRRVSQSSDRLDSTADPVVAAARASSRDIEEITATIDELATSARRVGESMHQFSSASEETSASILQMVASIEEVASNAQALETRVSETATATGQMVQSIGAIDRTVERLDELSGRAATAMTELSATIRGVEENAARNREHAEHAAREAEAGGAAIIAAGDGIEAVRARVGEAADAITSLSGRSKEIGEIVRVIGSVADQTSLLALNAAIIAAQAGEHGRGFAVVADEVRSLAERTAASSKEIAELIGAVRGDVTRAAEAMKAGVRAVDDGAGQQREAGAALARILEAARASAEMMGGIAVATGEQARAVGDMAQTVERVRALASEIGRATGEQTQGGTQVMGAVEIMRDIAAMVSRAAAEQSHGSSQIREAVERAAGTIETISRAVSEQARGAGIIAERAESLQTGAKATLDAAEAVRRESASLRSQAAGLEAELQRFKTG